jgi:hypothetical protein
MLRQTIPAFLSVLCLADPLAAGDDPGHNRPVGTPLALAHPIAGINMPERLREPPKPGLSISPEEIGRGGTDLFGDIGRKSGEHPLLPALRWAKQALPAVEKIEDYSARFILRERLGDKLGNREAFLVKIRHQPFSVYTCGLGPTSIKGQEAIYVQGLNDGKLWVHPAGAAGRLVHAISLDPNGATAMHDQRYPLTEIGILKLCRKMIAVGDRDVKHDDCQVTYFAGARINDRTCSGFQVTHSQERPYFCYHIARVLIDNDLKLPVRYEAYGWPTKPEDPPPLLEEYTYIDLKLNNGFTDKDFSIENPAYHFR